MKIKIVIVAVAAAFITMSAFLVPTKVSKKKSSSDGTAYEAKFQKSLSEINAFSASYPAEKAHAYYYDVSVFKNLLGEKNADGVRIYHCINSKTGERDVFLVAIDKNGNDILPADGKTISGTAIYGGGYPCPAICGVASDVFSLALYGPSSGNFAKKSGSIISYSDAVAEVNAYKAKYPNEEYRAFAYPKADINALLSGNADGLRIYHVVDAVTGKRKLILAKAVANDKLNKSDSGQWFDGGYPCPAICGNANGLNS